LGNWAFTKGDAVKSAELLAPYTDYVHFKNAADTDNGLIVTTDLAEGLFDWEAIYKLFDKTVDVALEFPMATNEQIAAQVTMLRHAMEAR